MSTENNNIRPERPQPPRRLLTTLSPTSPAPAPAPASASAAAREETLNPASGSAGSPPSPSLSSNASPLQPPSPQVQPAFQQRPTARLNPNTPLPQYQPLGAREAANANANAATNANGGVPGSAQAVAQSVQGQGQGQGPNYVMTPPLDPAQGGSNAGNAVAPAVNYELLLEQFEAEKAQARGGGFIPEPPQSTGNAGLWLSLGWRLLTKPFSVFLDSETWTGQGQGQHESEPMTRLRREAYRLGGFLILLFDAYLTQFLLLTVFDKLNRRLADEGKIEGFFQFGATVGGATYAGCVIFVLFLSFIQGMLFQKNKTPAQKFFILLAFATNIAFDFWGWAAVFGATDKLEWVPVAPFYSKGVAWASVVLYIAALLVAVGPELMRETVKRAKVKPLFSGSGPLFGVGVGGARTRGYGQPHGPPHGFNTSEHEQTEKGVWVNTPSGLQFISESVLRQRAGEQARKRERTGTGRGGNR